MARSVVVVSDEVRRKLKVLAAEEGVTMGEVVARLVGEGGVLRQAFSEVGAGMNGEEAETLSVDVSDVFEKQVAEMEEEVLSDSGTKARGILSEAEGEGVLAWGLETQDGTAQLRDEQVKKMKSDPPLRDVQPSRESPRQPRVEGAFGKDSQAKGKKK